MTWPTPRASISSDSIARIGALTGAAGVGAFFGLRLGMGVTADTCGFLTDMGQMRDCRRTAVADGDLKMRLISWNVQWGRNAEGDVNLARTIDEARRIADFDVLCMQEITRGFGVLPGHPSDDQFAELAAALPGFTVLDAIGADLAPLDAGARRRQFGNALAT